MDWTLGDWVLRRGGDEAAKSDLEWKAEQGICRIGVLESHDDQRERAEGRKPLRGKGRAMGHLYWARRRGG